MAAVNDNSLARCIPTARGSRALIPQAGHMPHLAWVSPSFASSAATIRSQPSTISSAPVKQKPFTLAITALGTVWMASISALAGSWRIDPNDPSSNLTSSSALRSTPAEKARPAPVNTMIPTASSAAAASTACRISSSMLGVSAFRTSGRLNVMVATPSAVS